MKEPFIQKIVSQPWSISRARGRALIASMVQRLRGERPEESDCGDPLPKMRLEGDVAVIPVCGPLAMNVPEWIKQWGVNLTDINDIAEELAAASADPRVAVIVLDFDSPGGWSVAGQKLFDTVNRTQGRMGAKPMLAWCADGADLCSAAYHGAMPASMILTGPYALAVGCIGTYQTIIDDTEFWKMLGITIDVLRSGELKGMGVDGYSEQQIAWLQSVADDYGAQFRADVSAFRTALDPAEMQGQFYDGATAARLGFTHGTAADLPSALAKFRRAL